MKATDLRLEAAWGRKSGSYNYTSWSHFIPIVRNVYLNHTEDEQIKAINWTDILSVSMSITAWHFWTVSWKLCQHIRTYKWIT